MATSFEHEVMARAIAEARRARPSPNPRVGAAIVREGRVLAIGHHAKAGAPHAEVDAISNAQEDVTGATLLVTLEPCNHHGRTGPCTDAILRAGIGRVVVGCRDPAPHVPGAIEKLSRAGVEVEVGVLEKECKALIADFKKHITTGLPQVTLKAAVTLDGKIATRTGDSKWITSDEARAEGHRLRADADAILVGIGTVLADDPALTVRHVAGDDPVRVLLDADLRTPPDASALRASGPKTIIFHAHDAPKERAEALRRPSVELIPISRDPRGLDLGKALEILGMRDVVRLLVEGGARVHGSFLDLGLADRAAIFIAPLVVGDAAAPSFASGVGVESLDRAWRLADTEVRTIGCDLLVTGRFERKR